MKNRILYFDILNIFACICVVYMHCTYNAVITDGIPWIVSRIVTCVAKPAVPIFVALSGANLLNYRNKYDTKTFFKKRFSRILIPFVAWSVVYFIFYRRYFNLAEFGGDFINCKIQDVFWFFTMILFIYVTIPVLSLLADKKETLEYAIIMIFIFSSCVPTVFEFMGMDVPKIFGYMGSVSIYIGYALLGYYIKNHNFKKKTRIIIYIAGAGAFLFKCFYTVFVSLGAGKYLYTAENQNNVPNIVMTVAIIVLAKYISWDKIFRNDLSKKILSTIASCSFGVYLMHMLLIGLEQRYLKAELLSGFYMLVLPLIVYGVGVGVTFIVKRIPVVGKIFTP